MVIDGLQWLVTVDIAGRESILPGPETFEDSGQWWFVMIHQCFNDDWNCFIIVYSHKNYAWEGGKSKWCLILVQLSSCFSLLMVADHIEPRLKIIINNSQSPADTTIDQQVNHGRMHPKATWPLQLTIRFCSTMILVMFLTSSKFHADLVVWLGISWKLNYLECRL